jgi:hypothetical protein
LSSAREACSALRHFSHKLQRLARLTPQVLLLLEPLSGGQFGRGVGQLGRRRLQILAHSGQERIVHRRRLGRQGVGTALQLNQLRQRLQAEVARLLAGGLPQVWR